MMSSYWFSWFQESGLLKYGIPMNYYDSKLYFPHAKLVDGFVLDHDINPCGAEIGKLLEN